MRKHTPEPWFIGRSRITSLNVCCIDSDGNEAIVASPNFNFSNHHEIARRIVACVNACAGMETEHLENQSMLGETLLDRFNLLKSEAGKLTKQRDQLLASLKDLLSSKAEPGMFAGVMAADNAAKLIKSIEDSKWAGGGHSPDAAPKLGGE